MRTDRKRDEPRSWKGFEQSEAEILDALEKAYEQGYADGIEEAQRQFIQAQILFMTPAGNA